MQKNDADIQIFLECAQQNATQERKQIYQLSLNQAFECFEESGYKWAGMILQIFEA